MKAATAKAIAAPDPWAEIATLRPTAGVIPKDAFTATEYAGRFGLAQNTARRELDGLVKSGKVQTAMAASGHLRRMYWLTKIAK